jgi:uncharacterized cupin superfamily protein
VSEPIVIPPGRGEVVGDSPQRRVDILSDDDTLHATLSRFAPGRDGADLHIHRQHTDLFFVLDGELTLRLGAEDERAVVPAGTLAYVPPLVVHGFRNGGDTDLYYLNLHAPGQGFADYMRGVRDGRQVLYDQFGVPEDGGDPASRAVLAQAREIAAGVRLHVDLECIAIAELRLEDGAAAVAAHTRAAKIGWFFVLEAELVLWLVDGEVRAGAGTWVQLPAALSHAVSAGAGGAVRYLSLHTPGCGAATLVPA